MRSGLYFSVSGLLVAGFCVISTAKADTAQAPCETEVCTSVRQYWSTVKTGTADAAHDTAKWTEKTGKEGWKDTKDAAHWTAKESKKGWNATKDGTEDAAHDTAKWTKKTAHKVGNWTSNTAKDTKDAVTGN